MIFDWVQQERVNGVGAQLSQAASDCKKYCVNGQTTWALKMPAYGIFKWKFKYGKLDEQTQVIWKYIVDGWMENYKRAVEPKFHSFDFSQ